MAIKYIETSSNGGSDSNLGTQASPWETMSKALSSLNNGDTLYVGRGIFPVSTTLYAKNIKIIGSGRDNTFVDVTSTPGAYAIYFWTDDFSASPIEISGITFKGNVTGARCLYIWRKNNPYIHDCSFLDFLTSGVVFGNSTPVTTWATGARFENNIVTNCAPFNNMNSASIHVIGQKNYRIINNQAINPKRNTAMPGALIKFNYTQGGLVEYNNLEVIGNNDGAGWAFALEFWNSNGGDEVRNNTIRGVIDMTGGTFTPGTYTYQTYIHDNIIGFLTAQSIIRHGIYIEGTSKYVIIEKNTISNVTLGVIIYTNNTHSSNNVIIRKNLFNNIGTLASNTYCHGIRQGGTTGFILDNYYIYNNTIVANPDSIAETTCGIQLPSGGTSTNIYIRNNIIQGFFHAPIRTESGGTGTINSLYIQNNNFYNNGDGNDVTYSGITPTNITKTSNIALDPLFVSTTDFTLQAESPCIDKGIYVGLDFLGNSPDIGAYEYVKVDEEPVIVFKGDLCLFDGKIVKYKNKVVKF